MHVRISSTTRGRSETRLIKSFFFFFFFRDAGKGLGKNENGITESIKVMANQNNAGVGYSDIKDIWWIKLYDDVAKAVESRANRVSLTEDNKLSEEDEKFMQYQLYDKFLKAKNKISSDNLLDDLAKSSDSEDRDTTGIWIPLTPSSGKLERIAEQDRTMPAFLDAGNMLKLNASSTRENVMAHRKISIDSDVEESEHEVDKSILPLQDSFFTSKSIKKKHRKKMNKLALQLGICNLGENVKLTDSVNNRKLCQKVKSEEGRTDPSVPTDSSKKERNDKTIQTIISRNDFIKDRYLKRLQALLDVAKRKPIIKAPRGLFRPWKDIKVRGDDIEGRIQDTDTQIENTNRARIRRNRGRNWLKNPCLPIAKEDKVTEAKEDSMNICDVVALMNSSKQDVSKLKETKNCFCLNKQQRQKNSFLFSSKGVPEMETKYQSYIRYEKIEKKKTQRSRSKNIKRIADKLKGEALAQELNTVIKDLTAFGLTEKVNANALKKKSTQTHLTPV